MEFKYTQNARYLIMAFIGMIMACLGYLTYMFNPQQVVMDAMTVLEPGTVLFNLWKEPPLEMFVKVYLFNVTNPKEFLAGKEKLRVQEVGPYVYRETLKNSEPIFNKNNTLTYVPMREHIFHRELSVGDPETDSLILPNVPLLGMGSYLTSFNVLVRLGFNAVTATSKPFLNLTVQKFLWGYEDKLVTLASTFIPSWIDFPTFGIMDRFAHRDSGNTVTMYLNESRDTYDNKIYAYSISNVNGSPGLKEWNYQNVGENETSEENSPCNTLSGIYDGGLLPKNYPSNTSFRLYRPSFCRPVPFTFENETINNDGFRIYNFRVWEKFLASGDTTSENKCYCAEGKCLPKGFGTLAPCYYGIPITISQPHYYNTDPKIREQVDGLEPDPMRHDSRVQLNPDLGIPVSAHLKIQVNLDVAQNSFTSVKKFSNLMVPLLWLELELNDLTPYTKFLLKSMLTIVPIVQDVIMWMLGILGLALIAAAALIVFYFPPHRRLEDPYGHRIGYSPILVLPLSSRLKEARIS